jgi:hypothetical protein
VPALNCYFKQVENKGSMEVRDVRWEVANFFRRVIRKDGAPASCPEVAGEPKPAPTNGRLQFGPSSEGYDTTVLQPKDGWGETASNTKPSSSNIGDQIETRVAFDIEDQKGELVPAQLTFGASVIEKGHNEAVFTYFVENHSDTPLRVLVNLSATRAMLAEVPLLQRQFEISPHREQKFGVAAEGPVTIEPADIVVHDNAERVVAIDSGSFYTIKGVKERSDHSYWESIK